MKIILIILGVGILFLLYQGAIIYKKVVVGKGLVAKAERYHKLSDDDTRSLLVLGDSTAVGVGASVPEDTIAARLDDYLNTTYVENHSVSGAEVKDLESQLANAKLDRYTYILIQIGGNDIIRFHDVNAESERYAAFLKTLPEHQKLIAISAGNVGGTDFFPRFLNPAYTKLNLKYHESFEKVITDAGGTYINLYEPPERDPYVQDPETHFAADGLHPSSEGYAVWFKKMKEKISPIE